MTPLDRTSSFSWRQLLQPKFLLTSLLALFARNLFPEQASSTSLVGRCSGGICYLPQVVEVAAPFFEGSFASGKGNSLEELSPFQSQLGMEIPPFVRREFDFPGVASHWSALAGLPFNDTEVDEHLEAIRQKVEIKHVAPPDFPPPYIVRSDGMEDWGAVTNAGKHESFPNLPLAELPSASAATIHSYFSREPLGNLLRARVRPFDRESPLSVIIQRYIAEEKGEIPVSFVLFTDEPMYTGREGWRFLRLSSTWGPGIVESGVGSDRVVCVPSQMHLDQVVCLIARGLKLERWAPEEAGGLKKIANAKELAERASLEMTQIQELYQRALLFKRPVDIEGVYRREWYLVQTRGVHRKKLRPSYLVFDPKAIQQTFHLKNIVPGKGNVVVITSPKQLLVVPTLEEADQIIDQYEEVNLVLARECPPEDAHAVINFVERQIPVLCPLKESIEEIDPEVPLIASMQNGTLSLWNTSVASPDIRKGYAVHPAPVAFSVAEASNLVPPSKPSLEFELFVQRGNLTELEDFFQTFRKDKAALEQTIEKPSFAVEQRFDALTALENALLSAFHEVRSSQNGSSLLSLFHQKVLRILFLGSNPPALGQYSLADVPTFFEEIETLNEYQKQLFAPPRFAELLLAGKRMPSQEVFAAWEKILLQFEGSLSQKEGRQFETFVQILDQTGALPYWLLFSLSKEPTLSAFQLDSIDASLLTDLLNIRSQLDQISFSSFANPKTFPAAWEDLQAAISRLPFLRQIQNASSPGRLSSYALLRKAIGALDEAIKAMKSSNNPNKLVLFEEMVRFFHSLARSWAKELVSQKRILKSDLTWKVLHRYLLQEIQWPHMEERQLFPSRDFCVAAALEGRSPPQHWHDYWTFFHQLSLSFLDVLFQREPIETSFLSQEMKKAIFAIEKEAHATIYNWSFSAYRVEFRIDQEKIAAVYNVPLVGHSSMVEISYDRSRKLIFQAEFFGLDERRRSELSLWIRVLREAGIFEWREEPFASERRFAISCSEIQDISSLVQEYAEMTSAIQKGFQEILDYLFNRWKDFLPQLADALLKETRFDIRDHSDIGQSLVIWQKLQVEGYILPRKLLSNVNRAFEEWIVSEDRNVRYLGVGLLTILVTAGERCDQALAIAGAYFEGTDDEDIKLAVHLWKALIRVGCGYEQRKKWIPVLLNHKSLLMQWKAFDLQAELVEKKQAYREAIALAEKGINLGNRPMGEKALRIWEALFNQGEGFQEALAIVPLCHSTSGDRKWFLLRLIKLLLEHGQGNELGRQAVGMPQEHHYDIIKTTREIRKLLQQKALSD